MSKKHFDRADGWLELVQFNDQLFGPRGQMKTCTCRRRLHGVVVSLTNALVFWATERERERELSMCFQATQPTC